ncbi:MAG: hypothetical protein ABSD88_07340, partial [Candidatus Korobacteraceae bacterium]
GFNNWVRQDNGQLLLVGINSINGSAQLTTSPGVVSGFTLGPNPLAPLGSLGTNWHKPYAGLSVDVHKGLVFKGMWYYYDYNEKDVENANVLLPRDFHANNGVVSLKYSF